MSLCVLPQTRAEVPNRPNEGLSEPWLTGPDEGMYAALLATRLMLYARVCELR